MSEDLSNRDLERMISNLTDVENADILFATFSSDIGTIRNAGRRGSSFAPAAILNVVKKLCSHNLLKWGHIEVASMKEEQEDFFNAQLKSQKRLCEVLKKARRAQRVVYLGGGHDHIYPAAMALNEYTSRLVIINLDAHLDTRTDKEANSGTPFRQLDRDFKGELEIVQLGIHEFANSISTMSNLQSAREIVATYEDVRYGTANFQENFRFLERLIPYQKGTAYMFSLDSDVMESSVMEAVSAVNQRGLPYEFIEDVLIYSLTHLKCQHYGLYEYNPLYDNLSQKGARVLAGLIYQIMDEREESGAEENKT